MDSVTSTEDNKLVQYTCPLSSRQEEGDENSDNSSEHSKLEGKKHKKSQAGKIKVHAHLQT